MLHNLLTSDWLSVVLYCVDMDSTVTVDITVPVLLSEVQ